MIIAPRIKINPQAIEYRGWQITLRERLATDVVRSGLGRYYAKAVKIGWVPQEKETVKLGVRGWVYRLLDTSGVQFTCGFNNPETPVRIAKKLIDLFEQGHTRADICFIDGKPHWRS